MIWIIEEVGEDRYDVLRGGRQVRADLSWDAARQYVKSRQQVGDKVKRREPDGYLVTVRT